MSSNLNKNGNWYETEVGSTIIKKKYLHEGETTTGEFFSRVSGIFSDDIKMEVREALLNGDFFPAGRSLYGAGSKGKFKASMSNCYILPMPKDNIEDIYEVKKKMARIFSYGGGTGLNISNLRPKGSPVHNAAKTSTGAVSFMEEFDVTGAVIGANNRRAALIIGMDCDHPDIEEFLEVKRNNDKIQSANISIIFTDEFMNAVSDNQLFRLHFTLEDGTVIEKKINAREFFHKFAEAQWDWAEPGALFKDRIQKHNLLSAYPKNEYEIRISNPCVSGDTPILTANGYRAIKDLVGKTVPIWNGYEWSEVTPKVTGANQQMKLVKLSNGMELKCTNYHKFVMRDGETRKRAEELVVGDKLAKWEYPVIQGAKLLEEAYTHGFYSGDGSVDSNNYPQICLYGEKKELTPYLSFDHLLDQQENQKRIVAVLKKDLNLNKKFVPDATFTVSSRLQWLAGLVDSDGCLNDFRGSVAISSINREFLRETQLMLSTLGCHSSVGVMREAGDREMPDGNGGKREYPCNKSYRLVISAYAVSELVKLGLITHRVPLIANPNRNAGRFIYVTEVVDLPIEPTVYCFNEPKNHTGVFNGIMTGQCAEYMGNEYNSCNLGSINLYNVVLNPFTPYAKVNFDKLKKLTRLGVIALDEILTYGRNMQPLEENKKCIDNWRAIGLGVFGLADMFIALGVRYGSDESVAIASQIMRTIFQEAVKTSTELAKQYGTFDMYNSDYVKKSPMIDSLPVQIFEDVMDCGLRNGSLLSIAPTGSIGTMAGMSGGVEPLFRVRYERTTHALEKSGKTFTVYAKSVQDLLIHHGYDPETVSVEFVKEAFPFVVDCNDIHYIDRINVQAAMQQYVDNAISSTINMPESATVEDVFDAYMYAWSKKCKGVTIFRDNCKRISILGKNTEEEKEEEVSGEEVFDDYEGVAFDSITPVKRADLDIDEDSEGLDGKSYKGSTACVPKLYTQVNQYNGEVFEIFTNAAQGCTSNINTITRLASLALRSGVKVEEVIKALKGSNCPACMREKQRGKKVSNSCGACIGEALENYYNGLKNGSIRVESKEVGCACEKNKEVVQSTKEAVKKLLPCPECGENTLRPEGKCFNCFNCGYSKCE